MTYILLWQGAFREVNPIANLFLKNWGVPGIVSYKFLTVAVVCSVAQIIACKRPDVARRLLLLATFVVCLVVLYSVSIMARQIFGG
jgi:hypothetical protein